MRTFWRKSVRFAPLIYRATLWLKRCHPEWGAAMIRVSVQLRYKDMAVPSERTLQRWFKTQHLYKPKSRFPALPLPAPAHQVHDVWQIDAKEKLQLGSGQKASYLSVVDEYSGTLLKATVFPHYHISEVNHTVVQQTIKQIFEQGDYQGASG